MDETSEIRTPADEDAMVEAAVMRQLLAEYPASCGREELTREIGGGRDDFAQRDAVERALRDLEAVGLVLGGGELVQASRAAVRLDELLG